MVAIICHKMFNTVINNSLNILVHPIYLCIYGVYTYIFCLHFSFSIICNSLPRLSQDTIHLIMLQNCHYWSYSLFSSIMSSIHNVLMFQPGSSKASPRSGDSWGDSDEELFDSPQAKTSQKQQLASLKSQLLTLQRENEDLKEKIQVWLRLAANWYPIHLSHICYNFSTRKCKFWNC